MRRCNYYKKMIWLALFAVAMAYFEAAVVVYLRQLFYPDSFPFPLKIIPFKFLAIELFREAATMLMLVVMAVVAGKKFWERFGYLVILFGIWDIFYYIWLKLTIGWPVTLQDWDILFLVPVPWLGPVIAPVLVALFMIVVGTVITDLYDRGFVYRPDLITWLLTLFGTGLILYSFTCDALAGRQDQITRSYLYSLLTAGLFLYGLAFIVSLRNVKKQ
ncbi:MAG: hypothetical protein JXA92_04270 [candidate division Zixibacteria bacterium]|nr:hypothetical protein [candidate division Zixibacteria bacterium]